MTDVADRRVIFSFALDAFDGECRFPGTKGVVFCRFTDISADIFDSLSSSFGSFPFKVARRLYGFSYAPAFCTFMFINGDFRLLRRFFSFFFLRGYLFL